MQSACKRVQLAFCKALRIKDDSKGSPRTYNQDRESIDDMKVSK